MPQRSESKDPSRCQPDTCRTEKKCETVKRPCDNEKRRPRKSVSPENRCKTEQKQSHKPDCGCKNCNASRECKPEREPKKTSHLVEKLCFSSSTSGIRVPAGATHMEVVMVGGGGGGGRFRSIPSENLHGGGGGGAGGTYKKSCFPVKSGHVLDVVIGAGGQGGDAVNGDGKDGENSELKYECHTKVANGGRGGSYNLNGGFGGKGGCATGCGEDGENGKNGCPGGRGGAGGKVDDDHCKMYGDGGSGGSDPANTVPPSTPRPPTPTPSPCDTSVSCRRDRRHKRSGHCDRRRDCESKCPAVPVLVGPDGGSGQDGYVHLTFYRDGPACHEPLPCEPIQHIKALSDRTNYWLNPDAEVVIVDTSTHQANLSLGRPSSKCGSHRIVIKLKYQQGLSAYVDVVSGGTFALSAANPIVTLFYSCDVWEVEDDTIGSHSFYPTTLQGAAHALECYKGAADNFTESTAISADGNTLAIGAAGDDSFNGAVFVYQRKGKCWDLQAKLVGTGAVGAAAQGSSVSLSADGNTLAVGGPLDNSGKGAVWVFVRTGCTWVQQGAKLVDATVSTLNQGTSVALSANGNILFVGAPLPLVGGVVLAYTRTLGVWSLVSSVTDLIFSQTGTRLAASADGTILAVGHNLGVGIYKFDPVTATLSIEFGSISGPLPVGAGISGLSLSSAGNVLALGMPGDLGGVGSVFVFDFYAGVWSFRGPAFSGSGYVGLPAQGSSLALSADGFTLAVGGPNNGADPLNLQGAIWIFVWDGSNWTQRELLSSPPSQGLVNQGAAVALSSNGSTLLVGNYVAPGGKPLFWVYA